MDNVDEGITIEERHIPQFVMNNLVQAVWSNCIPQDLNNLLKSSTRFRITSVTSNISGTPKGIGQANIK